MARRPDGTYTSQAGAHSTEHRAERAAWAPLVAAGTVACRRGDQCLEPELLIRPGEPWDLGHPDAVCDRPTAPEHRRCNRATRTHLARLGRRQPEIHPALRNL